ncbi:hypothetical protein BDB00DRAFT_822539 [Zychaea mexicana]|uniref:uncharacterized protein n=1 Tax=Zychaea mexicana TaxID=64656 RepID=UPI0022FEA02B|nr:uncharacterized protein BDB00DRAFT_822539 [Zychaea mexicana]KAI9493562.1 hypothetical protein BDB00DRAFT_822539 [Zychaea mexicana]
MVQTSGNHDVRYSSASNRLWIACEWGRGKGRTEGRWKAICCCCRMLEELLTGYSDAGSRTLKLGADCRVSIAESRMPRVECQRVDRRESNAESRMPSVDCRESNAESRLPES